MKSLQRLRARLQAGFLVQLIFDPWLAIDVALPAPLDIAALRKVHAIVQPTAWTLDETLHLIAGPVEIDRRVAAT
jgi:hypothetical protein